MVTEVPGLHLLERHAIKALGITVDELFLSIAEAISSEEIDRDLQSVVRNYVTTKRICSNRSWVVYETWSWKSSSNPNPNQSS